LLVKLVALLSSLLATLDGESTATVVPERNPVVLVHGIYSDSGDFARMSRRLRAEGWQVFTPDLKPNGGQAGIDELASQLARYIAREVPARKCDLVGFSMGGLVSRYYLQRLDGLDRVERFVSLAAPHHGTVLAHLHAGRGGRHMRPASDLLRDLARDADRLARVKFTSIYTPLDLVIIPARSSEMPQARNVRLWVSMHPSLILGKRGIRAVAAALKE
jgi:triacylglycerol lipase